MTPFQSFMILQTHKQDATKSFSEVCWAGSALGLRGPGSRFSKPHFPNPPRTGVTSPTHPLCGRGGAEPSTQKSHLIFTRAATAARPPQHRVPARLRFRGRARGGAAAAGASPRGHGGAVAVAATSGECPEARRAGPGPGFLLRPCPRCRSCCGGSERCPLPWRPGTTSRARVGGGAGWRWLPASVRAARAAGSERTALGLPLISGAGAGRSGGPGAARWVPRAGAAAFRRRPAGFGSPLQCDGGETFLWAVIRFKTPWAPGLCVCLCAHAFLVGCVNVPLNAQSGGRARFPGHRLLPEWVRVSGRLAKGDLACVASVCFAEVLLYRLYLFACLCFFACLVWHVCMLKFMPVTPGFSFESLKWERKFWFLGSK